MSKKYTVIKLKKICKSKGIKGYSKMKKAELMKHCLQKTPVKKSPLKKKVPKKKALKKKVLKKKALKKKVLKKKAKISTKSIKLFEKHISPKQQAKELLNRIYKAKVLEIYESYDGIHLEMDGQKYHIEANEWEDYQWFQVWFKTNFKTLTNLKKLSYTSRFASEVDKKFLNNYPPSLKTLDIDNLDDIKESTIKYLSAIDIYDEEWEDNYPQFTKYFKKIEFIG